MESYGNLLRKTREEKNLDLVKISREISIEKRYLEGLENEDSSVFPGEAYLVGFLKNYSNYLELDTELVLKLYHNKQIQESPLPEGLYEKKSSKRILPFLIPVAIFVVLVVTISILLISKKKDNNDSELVVSENSKENKYEIDKTKFVKRVYKGDQLLIPTKNEGKIILTVRDTLSSFGIDTPSGIFYVDLAEESELAIDGDNVSDMIIYVSDISSTDEK